MIEPSAADGGPSPETASTHDLRRQAMRAATVIAERLRDPDDVDRRVRADTLLNEGEWLEDSLARGPAVLALVAAELNDEPSAATVQASWRRTAAACSAEPITGPFGGLGTLASVARCLDAPEPVMTRLGSRVAEYARWLATAAHDCADRQAPGYMGTIDTLGGLAGLGRWLLAREHADLDIVLDALARLSEPRRVEGTRVPGWWVAPTERTMIGPEFAHGQASFALSHGICGPLMLMGLSLSGGREGGRLTETVATLLDQLWGFREHDDAGSYWPAHVPLRHVRGRSPGAPRPARASWCYGNLGIALTLAICGRAVGDDRWLTRARAVADAELARPHSELGIVDPGLCHGWAGHLHLLRRLAQEDVLGGDAADEEINRAAAETVACVDLGSPFGIVHAQPGTGRLLNLPGLLEGAAGVALSLLAYGRDAPPETGWDSLLLLS